MVRRFLVVSLCASLLAPLAGCKSSQYARVIEPDDKNKMVGSHQAGQETFAPLIDESVAKLLSRHSAPPVMQASYGMEQLPPAKLRVCFVGVENKTAEEIGDFKEQIYEKIDAKLLECPNVSSINRRYVDAGLRQTRVRPDELFVPQNMRNFAAVMEQNGQPFDYLVYAKLTSGTTRQNKEYQRDYTMTLEMIDIRTGEQDKQSAELSKGYHNSRVSRAWAETWPFGKK
ncbi:MAG: penicillin-binding protein activator LpoB [Pirellulales bacterium]